MKFPPFAFFWLVVTLYSLFPPFLHAADKALIPPEVRKLNDPELVSLMAMYDIAELDFELYEAHEKIAVRLLELNNANVLKLFLGYRMPSNVLSYLSENLLLAKVLGQSTDAVDRDASIKLLEQLLIVKPEDVVQASWRGDRSKSISSRNTRRLDVNATLDLSKEMNEVSFQQFSRSVTDDCKKLQLRAAELLVSLADSEGGTEAVLGLAKKYEYHSIAGDVFQKWLLKSVSNER